MRDIKRFMIEDDASTAVEYAVVLSLILVVCLVAISAVGEATFGALWDAVEALR